MTPAWRAWPQRHAQLVISQHTRSRLMKIIRPMSPLRRRMLEDMQIRNYSPHTIDGYLRYIAQFAKHLGTSPDRLGPEHIRTYQLHLLHQQASKSIFIQTVCALRFLYETTLGRPWMVDFIPYPKKPKKLPVILSRDEVKALLLPPRHLKQRAVLATLHATGLRVSDLCQLRGTDIDSQRMVIRVRQGKGQRDRFVMLSPNLLPLLRRYWKLYQLQSWLFPGPRVTAPITPAGVAHICTQAGHAANLTKAVYPHLLRHTFATPSAGGGGRPAPHQIVPRPRQSAPHEPLPPRRPPRAPCHRESPGRPRLTDQPGDPAMSRPPLEVADIVRQHGDAFRARYGAILSGVQQRALRAIALCRTAALGGHITPCDHCGHEEQAYNSCRHRCCPQCHRAAHAACLTPRQHEVLPPPC